MTLIHPYCGPIVLVAEIDWAAAAICSVAPSIKVVIASLDADHVKFQLTDSSGMESKSLDLIAPDICAGIAFSEDGFQVLSAIADKARKPENRNEHRDFEIVRVACEKTSTEEISIALQEALVRVLSRMARRNAGLVRALAEVRREHEVLQEAFASLEEVVAAGNLPDKTAFALLPTHQCLSPGRNWAKGESIIQRLPVSSRAVSALDLYFVVPDEESKGSFDITLRSLEDYAEAGRWRLPFSKIASGWNQLQLDQGIMGQPRTLEIDVMAEVVDGDAPELVLAAPSAVEDAGYRTSSGLRGDFPLAFRVWRSLPGLRTNATVGAFRTYGTGAAPASQRISAATLRTAQAIGNANADPEHRLVQFIDEQGELQVHPRPGGIVAAFLKGAIPPFANRVTAYVITRHPQADVLDYGIVAVHGRIALDEFLASIERAEEPTDGFSGWSSVAPMEPSQISLSFKHIPRTSLDLVLMTRPHNGARGAQGPLRRLWIGATGKSGHTRFAWARFVEIQVELTNQ